MADRAWAFVPDPQNKHRSGIAITCADCDKTAFFAPNSGGRFPPNAAETHFKREGWTVGKGPRRDFCPIHSAARAEKSQTSNVVELPKAMPTPSPSQTAPRIMSRDDRRVIIAEIKGCYDEGNKRYMDGWHDARVAQALGAHVPVAWVKECREDYFGEGASNEQFDSLIKRFDAAEAEFTRIEKNELGLSHSITLLQKTIEEMKPLIRDVRRAIGK